MPITGYQIAQLTSLHVVIVVDDQPLWVAASNGSSAKSLPGID